MNKTTTYDVIGIGIGPFNLGLAALCHGLPLQTLFLDQKQAFDWHPGLLIEGARMQVPFYADLVTLADPCSPFSYFAYLKAKGRFFRFALLEQPYITRKEYQSYCQWVVCGLNNLQFSSPVTAVHYSASHGCYQVTVTPTRGSEQVLRAKRLVIGVGTTPALPAFARPLLSSRLFHSSAYLFHKEEIQKGSSVLLVGSGQSAAEIFYDLLSGQHRFSGGLHWYTRSARFFPMDFSKLSLELSSPDYVDYFYTLSRAQKEKTLASQQDLYKGINASLLGQIYDYLDNLRLEGATDPIKLTTHCSLQNLSSQRDQWLAHFYHTEEEKEFYCVAQSVILATGFDYTLPPFLEGVREEILWQDEHTLDVQRHYSISRRDDIFVQNTELHSHGFSAPDLGLGPYRNAVILNTILGCEQFPLETGTSFQSFGIPQ